MINFLKKQLQTDVCNLYFVLFIIQHFYCVLLIILFLYLLYMNGECFFGVVVYSMVFHGYSISNNTNTMIKSGDEKIQQKNFE